MKINNQSMAAISVSEDGGTPFPLSSHLDLETAAKNVILEIHHTPCQIAIEGQPEATMNVCHYCLIKDSLCVALKSVVEHALRNTDIDGSQLCPLMLAAVEAGKGKE